MDTTANNHRSVLVTGAGQGMGRAMALGLVEQGARVAMLDVRADLVEPHRHLPLSFISHCRWLDCLGDGIEQDCGRKLLRHNDRSLRDL